MKHLTIAALACLAACKDKPKAASQTFAEGMALVCGAADTEEARAANPADRNRVISEWIDARVTHPEARNVFAAVGALSLPEVQRVLDEEARKAGLAGCALARTLDPLANAELPEVGDLPLEPVPEDAILVIAGETAVVIEGIAVVPLSGGALDPADLEGGSAMPRAPRLRQLLEAMEAAPVMIALRPDTRHDTLLALGASILPRAPALTLLVRGAERPGAIPLHLPDRAPASALTPAPVEEPLGMVVALHGDDAIVFSISGQEGTLQEPLVRVPLADAPARLRAALGDLAKRRWYGRDDRSAEDRRIVVVADRALPASAVIPVVAAARESFPEVVLGSGFE